MGINSYGEAWHVDLTLVTDEQQTYLESELERIDRVLGYAFDALVKAQRKNDPLTIEECKAGIEMIQELYEKSSRLLHQMYPSYSIKHSLLGDRMIDYSLDKDPLDCISSTAPDSELTPAHFDEELARLNRCLLHANTTFKESTDVFVRSAALISISSLSESRIGLIRRWFKCSAEEAEEILYRMYEARPVSNPDRHFSNLPSSSRKA